MENTQIDKKEPYVKQTLESGLAPIELVFRPIDEVAFGDAMAYLAEAVINSVTLGRLSGGDYQDALADSPVCEELFLFCLDRLVSLLKKGEDEGAAYEWIALEVPASLIGKTDLYQAVTDLVEKYDLQHKERLCLVFDETLFTLPEQEAGKLLADLHLLKVRTMMRGVCGKTFPLHQLSRYPMGMALLDSSLTAQLKEENGEMLSALTAYLKSMGCRVLFQDFEDDEQRKLSMIYDTYAFLPSLSYTGTDFKAGLLSENEIV